MSELALIDEAYTPDRIALIKRTICMGATDDELQLFIGQCQRTRLDPFARQIYAIKRWNSQAKREVMAVQVSIDGFRLVAERTGHYAPGPKPSFREEEGQLVATAYVKKYAGGEWHTVDADAYWDEYVVTTKDGKPTHMWASKPRIMLAKCAESLALRRAFPQELSGLYTADEMGQADNPKIEATPPPVHDEPEAEPDVDRHRIAAVCCATMEQATNLAMVKAAWASLPKGFTKINDEPTKLLEAVKDRKKYIFLANEIDRSAADLGFDQLKLDLLADELGIKIGDMNAKDAERLLDALKREGAIA